MFNSKTDKISNLFSLTFYKLTAFAMLCVVALLTLFSQSVQADILAYENFQGNARQSISGQGGGFGFSDKWSYTTTASVNFNIGNGDVTMVSPAPLKKLLTEEGKAYLDELCYSGKSSYGVTFAARTLSNSIDFSQPGEYYLSYNIVQWGGSDTNSFHTIGIGCGTTSEGVHAGTTWTLHSDAHYTTNNSGFPGVSGVANAFSLGKSYTVLEKITVDGNGNNTISYKVYTTDSTLPQNASDITWDGTKSFNSTSTYNRLEMRLSSANGNYLQANEIRLGTTYGDVTGILDNPQAGTSTGLAQRSIGLNFTGQNATSGSEKALTNSDIAGADGYTQAMWNNIRLTNSSTSGAVQYAMFDNLGSMEYYKNSTSYNGTDYMSVNYTTNSQSLDTLSGSDANTSLMSGHADGTTAVTLGNIPYDYYDVVVYMSDTDATKAGSYWITDSSGNTISDTMKFTPSAYSGTWKQAQYSGDSGNYYVFRGLTTDNITLNSTDGSITAMQIVGHNSTMYLVTGDWSDALTIDGKAYTGVQFDSQTTTSTKSATHSGTVALNADATFQIGNGYNLTQTNTVSGTGQLIKTGTGTVELTNQNTFTGNVTVLEGVLKASKYVTDGYSAGALGDANVEGRTITVKPNGTLEFAAINVLGGAGCSDFKTRVIVDGGTIQNSNSAFTLLNNPDFKNGATLIDNSGFGDWKSYMLNGKVSITADDKTKGDANQVVFKIGTGGNANGIYFHNNAEIYVDDVTGNDTTDLLVDNYLVNSPMGTNCSFTKTGSGTMELTRENINTGNITVSEGVLKVTKAANGYGNGALGNIYTDRTITVGEKGEILFTTINVLGGDTVTGIKSKVVVDGGKLSTLPSTNTVFVALTDATLKNGGQIIDNGGFYNYKAYILHGTTTVSADDVTKGLANQCKLITTELGGSHGIVPDSANSIFDVANVTGDASTDLLVSAFISDSVSVQGRIYKTGLGTMELTYENNYSAGTTVENGILKVSGNGTLGSADVNLLENGTLEFSPSDKSTKTVGNKITGAGQLVKTGAGTTELTNQNSFTGNIVVSEGVLKASKRVTDGYSAGALGDANVDGRTITVESNGTLEFADINVLGGAGCSDFKTRVIVDGGTVQNSNNAFTLLNNPDFKNGATLIDNNGYAGGWKAYMFNGKVSITADDKTKGDANQVEFKIGTNGDANGIYFHNNAEIYVDDVTGNDTTDLLVNDYLVNSPMGTNGSFTKTGSGTMELTYANVYSGGTTISEGTLKLSGNGTLGTGPVTINENGTLEYDVEIAKNITNVISGNGTVLVTGTGTLDMSQDITAKQLDVNASTLQMANGKTLTGSMTIGENGQLEIGTDTTPATATITSNLTVDADGKLNFDFSSPDEHDVLNLGGEFNFADNAITLSFNEDNESDWFDGLSGNGYQLISMTGNTLTGDLSRYLDTTGLTQDWSLVGLSTGLYLTATPAQTGVPEPSTWALLILGFAGLMWRLRSEKRETRSEKI